MPQTAQTKAHAPIEVGWVRDLEFQAGRAGGPKVRIDGDGVTAPSPFDVFLAALASCAATDVVTILKKQRTPARALQVRLLAQRLETTPRRLASAELQFRIDAPGATRAKVDRAVGLAVTKYCSVRSSLLAEAAVSWSSELTSAEPQR